MRTHAISTVLLAALVSVSGCDLLDPQACPSDLQVRVTPTEADLRPGETVTARAEALGCGGTERLEEDMRWSSEDPGIATVDEMTGRITARGAGSTTIVGDDLGRYRIGPVTIAVTVTP